MEEGRRNLWKIVECLYECGKKKKTNSMEEETPNSMYITADVLEDLLLKVPLKSLCRFKSVSKEWKSILESKRFVERHLSLAKASQKILLAAYHCNCGVSPSLLPESRFEGGEEFFSLHCDATRPSMNCDGLVCFPEAEWVDVLNPSTGQLWRFNSPSLLNPRPNSTTFPTGSWSTYFPGYCAMGFGKDSVKGSYKVVRIFGAPNYCDILDINTGEWRKLWKPRRFKVDVGRKSASVNGSIYWLRIRPHGSMYTILSLDLHTEEFRDVQRPPLPKGIMFEAQIVNIGDRLAIAIPESHPVHQYVLNIWIMDAQEETWTNSHSISLASLGMVESRSFTPVTLSKHGNVVFYDDKMWLFKYYPHTDQLQILSKKICIISPYLQNLVLLQTQQVEFKTGITCICRETNIKDVEVGQSKSVDEILSEGIDQCFSWLSKHKIKLLTAIFSLRFLSLCTFDTVFYVAKLMLLCCLARSGYCGNVVKIAFLMKLCSIIGF